MKEKKQKRRKKVHQSSTSTLSSTWGAPLKKWWRDTFKTAAEGGDWMWDDDLSFSYSLARVSPHHPLLKIIFIFIKKLNRPQVNLLITKKISLKKKNFGYKFENFCFQGYDNLYIMVSIYIYIYINHKMFMKFLCIHLYKLFQNLQIWSSKLNCYTVIIFQAC